MAFTPNHRMVNPRLGSYFGIFTSLFVASLILVAMFEQLGFSDQTLRATMLLTPALLFLGLGISTATETPADYYAAGRRIPAFFNGLVIAITALGGVGFICLTGTILIAGVDAFALILGWVTGLVLMVVLLFPYLRKFGAYTVAGYLGQRFDSRALRIAAAAVLIVPALLILIAEIRLATFMSAALWGTSERIMTAAVVVISALVVAGGGMRSLTWSSTAKSIVALVALAIPVTIVALLVSNLPLPQLSHGNLLRTVARMELDAGIATIGSNPFTFALPGTGFEPIQKRFLQSFGHIGSLNFSITALVLAAGIAASPALLSRAGTTTSVYESRKSLGWAVLFAAFALLTLTAVAVFLRGLLVEQVVGADGGQLPAWFQALQQIGIASIDSKSKSISLGSIGFRRDTAIFALPIASGFPRVLTYLAMTGALAAALAAIASGIMTVGATISEDVVTGLRNAPLPARQRIFVSRLAIALTAAIAGLLAQIPADPLELALWSLTLTAATGFPVLVLSVLWKRMNAWGAIAGLIAGLLATAATLLLGELGSIALKGPAAALLGLPAALVAIALVTRLSSPPDRHILELVRDMRVPGGESLIDRRERLARLKQKSA